MEKIKAGKPKNTSREYDRESDVLEISFGSPVPALSRDMGSGIVMRYLEKTGEVVGFTVIGVSGVLKTDTKHNPAPC